jgi:hypothetical protein
MSPCWSLALSLSVFPSLCVPWTGLDTHRPLGSTKAPDRTTAALQSCRWRPHKHMHTRTKPTNTKIRLGRRGTAVYVCGQYVCVYVPMSVHVPTVCTCAYSVIDQGWISHSKRATCYQHLRLADALPAVVGQQEISDLYLGPAVPKNSEGVQC